jgi:hypothetical protein
MSGTYPQVTIFYLRVTDGRKLVPDHFISYDGWFIPVPLDIIVIRVSSI